MIPHHPLYVGAKFVSAKFVSATVIFSDFALAPSPAGNVDNHPFRAATFALTSLRHSSVLNARNVTLKNKHMEKLLFRV